MNRYIFNLKSRRLHIFLVSFILLIFSACKKLIEVDPPIQSLTSVDVYDSNASAASVLTGIYINMSSSGVFSGKPSIGVLGGLSSDELTTVVDPSSIFFRFYQNSLVGDNDLWINLYSYIFRVNSAIEGLSSSKNLVESVKGQLTGEAKVLRAFYYFYLVNLYGDVPLLTSTNIQFNSTAPRTNIQQVYQQIIQDLKDAQMLLKSDYVAADAVSTVQERLRPNKDVATALLARVYLYLGQWSLAEETATELIAKSSRFKLENLEDVFLNTSKEAIWQIQPVEKFFANTLDGQMYILATNNNLTGPDSDNRPYFLSSNLKNSFEKGDKRKKVWTDSVEVSGVFYAYPFKYKQFLPSTPKTEYQMVIRLGEMYLIRAEARANLNKLQGTGSALEDLNFIRHRAGLEDLVLASQNDILNAIFKERQSELFTEWGHRWLDLKRAKRVDEVMQKITPSKGGVWSHYKALFPISQRDIKYNPSLKGHQNPGYPEQ